MRTLSLTHLTLSGGDPIAFIDAAAETGFDHIGIRIVVPAGDSRMGEAFWISPDFEPLGAERANPTPRYALAANQTHKRKSLGHRSSEPAAALRRVCASVFEERQLLIALASFGNPRPIHHEQV
jgi:hypothetical protein